ncbi:hypothetical protein MC885_007523 [Smutsia gigantea]|nr:hypothetical protein MC885_007523 [Smutsia gigantea]
MEKSIILLFWLQCVKTSKCFHYSPMNKQTTAVFIEWDEFPKGESPEFYFLKYQRVNNFAQKNVKSIVADPQKLLKSIVTLEENEDYHIIIQSIKYGQILSEKSFKTRGFSISNVKIIATSTSVSFNWSVLFPNDISVSISLNNSSRIMHDNVMVYEWDNLKPGTLHTFTFDFKQLHLDFINIFHRLDIQVETDYTEEQHFESMPPNTTEKTIKQLSPGHIYRFLLFAMNKWEAKTTLSPVFTVETRPLSAKNVTVTHVTPSEIFLHWDPPDTLCFHHYLVTILDVENNRSEEVSVEKLNTSVTIGDLRSFHHYLIYLFSVAERGTLSCFEKPISAITGINPPQKVFAKPEDVGEDSMVLQWELPQDGHEVYIQIKSVTDAREVMELFVKDANRYKIDNLTPGMTYDIGMATVMNGNLSKLVTIQQTLKVGEAVEAVYAASEEGGETPAAVYVASAEGGEAAAAVCAASAEGGEAAAAVYAASAEGEPIPAQIVIPYENNSTSVVLFVQTPDIGVFDGLFITIEGGPNVTVPLKHDSKITVGNLTPGTEYNFFVSIIGGTILSHMYYVPTVKMCLEAPLNIHEGKITDSSIEVLWNRADGNFRHYEITCLNCAATFLVQKVVQEVATFSKLDPATVYTFSILMEKEGFKDSTPNIKEIQTDPDPPSDLLIFGQEENTIYLSWQLPQGGFEKFQVKSRAAIAQP